MEKKRIVINSAILLSLFTLAVGQVVILNRYSTSGKAIFQLSQEIEKVEDENTSLTQEIASASALAVVYRKAEGLGMTNTSRLFSLTTPLPVAYTPDRTL